MIGQTLAHYGFEGLLGEGGSGVVYRGRDLRLERPVAIKVLADALRDDELAWARLLREARLASQLNHPHIATIHDLGEEDGRAYIVMEYVEGLPLADLIPEGGMPLEQVKQYAEQISDALAFAHEHGTLHGDLKGSNIIVTPEGNVKLLDFGLGRRIPRTGTLEVSSSKLPLAEVGATAGTLPISRPKSCAAIPPACRAMSGRWAFCSIRWPRVSCPFAAARRSNSAWRS
jgi:serine/threonine protein kinase